MVACKRANDQNIVGIFKIPKPENITNSDHKKIVF